MKQRVKFTVIALFVAIWVVIALTDDERMSRVHALSGGPPPGNTGAPAEETCANASCHGGTADSGPGLFTIEAPMSYEPGETYEITVTHATDDGSRRRWGFQLTVLALDGDLAGELQSTDILTSIIEDDGPAGRRQYVQHTPVGTFPGTRNEAVWRFAWTAPESDAGPVLFYAAGNQADNNGNSSGDQIYTASEPVMGGPPQIDSATVSGKRLIVTGRNLDIGAKLMMDGVAQRKVSNDSESPFTTLIAKKSGKKIAPLQTVTLVVENPDGKLSNEFDYRRPEG